MAKLKFLEPEVEVITFDEKDVITTSPGLNVGGGGGENGGEDVDPLNVF